MKKMELLIPAGSPESLKTAVLFGADAVYVGGPAYGLRAKAKNFTMEELAEDIRFAHAHGVKVFVTVNIIAHERHFEGLEEYLKALRDMGADALIVADAGIAATALETVPELPVHLSTQASATNSRTMNFWHRQGIKRIVCAREISMEELSEIRRNTPESLELEVFVHGAMCISISGRCLLSNYLTGRDANLGECTHPCRWKYRLVEETRPGEYYPIGEDENGAYIMNSGDLCMIGHLEELRAAGVESLKVEGRMKTPLYVAMVTKAYREALDDLYRDPALYEQKKPYYLSLVSMVSHRKYNTGFFFGHPDASSQLYDQSDYEKSAIFAGKVLQNEEGYSIVEQRNYFAVGDSLLALIPQKPLLAVSVQGLRTLNGEAREKANHAREILKLETDSGTVLPEGTILMRKEEI